jgi:hypothetical protein
MGYDNIELRKRHIYSVPRYHHHIYLQRALLSAGTHRRRSLANTRGKQVALKSKSLPLGPKYADVACFIIIIIIAVSAALLDTVCALIAVGRMSSVA